MEDYVIYFIGGLIIGKVFSPILIYYLESIEMWYKNKYGKFTPGEAGKNYLQIFKKDINI